MPLVKSVFENELKGILAAMQDGSKSDAWMADQIGDAIHAYVGSGQVATTDSGTAPAGSYTGTGTGTMAINAGTLKSKLKTTFEAKHKNDDLAANIAGNINDACAADDTIATDSSGMVATPTGPIASSGKGKGKFSGDKTSIETALQSCFSSMNERSKGGDDFLAAQLADAVTAYLKAGTISVTLQSPFTVGSGTGGLA